MHIYIYTHILFDIASAILYYVLYYTAIYYTMLCCTVLYYTMLYCTILCYTRFEARSDEPRSEASYMCLVLFECLVPT